MYFESVTQSVAISVEKSWISVVVTLLSVMQSIIIRVVCIRVGTDADLFSITESITISVGKSWISAVGIDLITIVEAVAIAICN